MKKETPVIAFNYSRSVNVIGLPVIKTADKSNALYFIIDSGSTHNILSASVYEAMKENISDSDEKQNFFGVDGIRHTVSRAHMALNICGIDYEEDFNVVDLTAAFGHINEEGGMQLHGILGMEFLIKNHWVVDFGSNVIYIPTQAA